MRNKEMYILHASVNPNGAACFPYLHEGSIDDFTLFNQCRIMNHINCGDPLETHHTRFGAFSTSKGIYLPISWKAR